MRAGRGGDRVAGPARLLLDRDLDARRAGARRAAASGCRRRSPAPRPASRAASSGHRIIGRPQIGCRTLGSAERIRVPSPAARMTTVGAGMGWHRSIGSCDAHLRGWCNGSTPGFGAWQLGVRIPAPESSAAPACRLRHTDAGRSAAIAIRRLAAVADAALLSRDGRAAGDPIMPLGEVRPGMQCTGYSVVRGTDVGSFDVEVIDVVDDRASGQRAADPRARVRAGGRRDRHRARASPARRSTAPTRTGRSATSARSRSRSASTAARSCSRRRSRRSSATRSTRRARSTAGATLARARPLAAPLTVTGLSAAARPRAPARGRARAGGSCSRRPPGRSARSRCSTLRPGSAFGVGYASGDISVERDRHRRLHRRRPRVGLRPPARRRRRALAAAPGRLRVPRRQQPARDPGSRRHVQVRGRGPRRRHAHQRRARRRRRPRRRACRRPCRCASPRPTSTAAPSAPSATNVADESGRRPADRQLDPLVRRAARGHAGRGHGARRLARAADRARVLRDRASRRCPSPCASATATSPTRRTRSAPATSSRARRARDLLAGARAGRLVQGRRRARDRRRRRRRDRARPAAGVPAPRRGCRAAARAGKKVRATLVLQHVRGRVERRRVRLRLPSDLRPGQAPRRVHRRRRRRAGRRTCSSCSSSTSSFGGGGRRARPAQRPPAAPADRRPRPLRRRLRAAAEQRPRGLRPRRAVVPRPGPADLGQRASDPDPDPAALGRERRAQVGRQRAGRRAAPPRPAARRAAARGAASRPRRRARPRAAARSSKPAVAAPARGRDASAAPAAARAGRRGTSRPRASRRRRRRSPPRGRRAPRRRAPAPSRGQSVPAISSGPRPIRSIAAPSAAAGSRGLLRERADAGREQRRDLRDRAGDRDERGSRARPRQPRPRRGGSAAPAAAARRSGAEQRRELGLGRAVRRGARDDERGARRVGSGGRRSPFVEPVHDAGRRERGRVDPRQRRGAARARTSPCSPRSARAGARPASRSACTPLA